MKTRRFYTLILYGLFTISSAVVAANNEGSANTPLAVNIPIPAPTLLASNKAHLYIFDERSNRLAVLDRNNHLLALTGEIGTDRGQFFHPSAMAANDQSVVLLDIISNRLQFLNPDGSFKSECRFNESISSRTVALTPSTQVLVNTPSADHVITAFDTQCRKLFSFASPTTLSELYSSLLAAKNQDYKFAANRLWLTTDKDGNTYAAYLVAPVLSKYDRNGNLLWTRKFDQAREAQFQQYTPKKGGMSTGVDGVQAPFMTKAVLPDENGNTLVLCSVDLFKKDRFFQFSPVASFWLKRMLRFRVEVSSR